MEELEAWRQGVWKLYEDNNAYIRHHEIQRSTVATLIISIASAALAIATFDKSLSAVDLPLLGVVVALGIFGIIFSRKQFERTCMHVDRATALVRELEPTLKGSSLLEIVRQSDARHNPQFRFLSRCGVHSLWAVLYLFVACTGLVTGSIALFHPF